MVCVLQCGVFVSSGSCLGLCLNTILYYQFGMGHRQFKNYILGIERHLPVILIHLVLEFAFLISFLSYMNHYCYFIIRFFNDCDLGVIITVCCQTNFDFLHYSFENRDLEHTTLSNVYFNRSTYTLNIQLSSFFSLPIIVKKDIIEIIQSLVMVEKNWN